MAGIVATIWGLCMFFSADTRIGLSYKSKIVNELKGRSYFESGTFGPILTTSKNFRLSFASPAVTMMSFYHTLNSLWTIMGTLDYTSWSSFDYIKSYNVAQLAETNLNVITPEKFRNVFHFAAAINYAMNDNLKFRFGLGYDQDPVKRHYRSILFPNGRAIAIALGARYIPFKKIMMDIGYLHSFIKKVSINSTLDVTQAHLTGHLNTTADILGMQLVWDV